MLNQIEAEIGEPVAVASTHVADNTSSEPVVMPVREAAPAVPVEEDLIPTQMPVYKPESPIPAGPKTQIPQPAAPVAKEKVSAKDTAVSVMQVAEEIALAQTMPKPEYCFPPIDLLRKPPRSAADGTAEMRENSRRLNETLESFKIDAHIINVTRGPRLCIKVAGNIRYEKLFLRCNFLIIANFFQEYYIS